MTERNELKKEIINLHIQQNRGWHQQRATRIRRSCDHGMTKKHFRHVSWSFLRFRNAISAAFNLSGFFTV